MCINFNLLGYPRSPLHPGLNSVNYMHIIEKDIEFSVAPSCFGYLFHDIIQAYLKIRALLLSDDETEDRTTSQIVL